MVIFLDTFRKFSKLSEIIFVILRNDLIPKIFGKNSRNFTKFWNTSRKFPKYFSKSSKILPEIFWNVFRYNSQIFRKYSSKFSAVILENFLIFLLNIFKLFLKIFGNISGYLAKFFKLSKIIFDIVLTSRTIVCCMASQPWRTGAYWVWVHSVQWHTSDMFCRLHLKWANFTLCNNLAIDNNR